MTHMPRASPINWPYYGAIEGCSEETRGGGERRGCGRGKEVKGKRGRQRGEWQVGVDNMCNMMDILCMVSWNNVTAGTGRKRTRQKSKAEKRRRKN